jgi:formate dehydrogenase iron-sulfur subunit
VCGVLPLALLSRASLRAQPRLLLTGALLTTLGVILNRTSVVYLAINLKGPMPGIAPKAYSPTVFEWGLSVGLIALTIFLFGLGARLFPLLPKEETAS